jgi:hypothetical protein
MVELTIKVLHSKSDPPKFKDVKLFNFVCLIVIKIFLPYFFSICAGRQGPNYQPHIVSSLIMLVQELQSRIIRLATFNIEPIP